MKNIRDTPSSLSSIKNQSRSNRIHSLQMHLLGPLISNIHQSPYSTTLPTSKETPIGLIKYKQKMYIHNRNSIFNSIFSHIKKTSEEMAYDISEVKKNRKLYQSIHIRSESNPNPNIEKAKKMMKDKLKYFHIDSQDLRLSSLDNTHKQDKDKDKDRHRNNKDKNSKMSLPVVIPITKPLRIKTFIVKYNPKWNHIEETVSCPINNIVIKDIEIQRHMILDQITLILDNIQNYKLAFFGNNKIKEFFNVISPTKQRELNKTIEEMIGLMIEISYLIIMDLSHHIDKFIMNPQKRFTKEDNKPVTDEEEELSLNGRLFNEASLFLKSCNEVYDSACKEETDFIFPKNTFLKIIQYLERCRMNISKLSIMSQNLYKNYINDLKITKKYSSEMKSIEEESSRNSKFKKEDNEDYYTLTTQNERMSYRKNKYDGGIDYTNYKGTLKIQISEEKDKIQRMDKILGKVNDNGCLEKKKDKIRKQIKKKFDINSRLIDMILKYSTSDFKKQIQSERVKMRFKLKEAQGINYDC